MILKYDRTIAGKRENQTFLRTWLLLLIIASFAFVMAACSAPPAPEPAEYIEPEPLSESEPPPEVSEVPPDETPTIPVGQMAFTSGRIAYEDGDMWLILPRLDLQEPIYTDEMDRENIAANNHGVTDATLENGVCLFGISVMPGEAVNANTALAGHRDVGGEEFYYLDTVTDGDLMYLDYDGNRYTYLYETTIITEDDDWDPIRAKEYACLTLQTCTPIGKASHRMFVIARLLDVTPLDNIDHTLPPAATIDELEDL